MEFKTFLNETSDEQTHEANGYHTIKEDMLGTPVDLEKGTLICYRTNQALGVGLLIAIDGQMEIFTAPKLGRYTHSKESLTNPTKVIKINSWPQFFDRNFLVLKNPKIENIFRGLVP